MRPICHNVKKYLLKNKLRNNWIHGSIIYVLFTSPKALWELLIVPFFENPALNNLRSILNQMVSQLLSLVCTGSWSPLPIFSWALKFQLIIHTYCLFPSSDHRQSALKLAKFIFMLFPLHSVYRGPRSGPQLPTISQCLPCSNFFLFTLPMNISVGYMQLFLTPAPSFDPVLDSINQTLFR